MPFAPCAISIGSSPSLRVINIALLFTVEIAISWIPKPNSEPQPELKLKESPEPDGIRIVFAFRSTQSTVF